LTNDKEMTMATWMIDGKPGQILALMNRATVEMGAISAKRGNDGSASTTAQDVFDVVRETLTKVGITLRVFSSDVEHHVQKSLYVTCNVTLHYCAPDGSYFACNAPGGATAPNRKSTQAAVTAAVKSIHRHTFMMQIVEAGSEPPRRMSPELQAHKQYLDTLNTAEELRTANAHETGRALAPEDWGAASELWDDRMRKLVNLDGMDKRAWQKAREQHIASEEAKKASFARKKTTTVAKGKAIDLRDNKPLHEPPSERSR
jgi:hypothetical protein